jgi:hypothetical protein
MGKERKKPAKKSKKSGKKSISKRLKPVDPNAKFTIQVASDGMCVYHRVLPKGNGIHCIFSDCPEAWPPDASLVPYSFRLMPGFEYTVVHKKRKDNRCTWSIEQGPYVGNEGRVSVLYMSEKGHGCRGHICTGNGCGLPCNDLAKPYADCPNTVCKANP